LQRGLVRNLAIPAEAAGRSDLLPLWAGQSANLSACTNVPAFLNALIAEISEIAGRSLNGARAGVKNIPTLKMERENASLDQMLSIIPHCIGSYCGASFISIEGSCPGKGSPRGTPDFYRTIQIDGLSIFTERPARKTRL